MLAIAALPLLGSNHLSEVKSKGDLMTDRHHSRSPSFLLHINSLLSAVEKLMLATAALCVIAILLVTAVDVVGRYALNHALGWAYDTALVLMVGMVFLSISSIQAARGHVAVEVLYEHLPPTGRWLTACLHVVAGAFGFFLIGWKNFEYAAEAARLGWVYGGFGAIPTWVPYGFISLGSFLMAIRMVEQLLRMLFEGASSPLFNKKSTDKEVR
jgi:TRAP-type C4-dicarboxylate transport system permease small subunit